MTIDKIIGSLMGGAVGDALGMPVEGFSHQNVRTFYKGIKGYADDEKRGDLKAGQWTDDTQLTFTLVRAMMVSQDLTELPDRLAALYVDALPGQRRWGGTTRAAVEALVAGASWRNSGHAAEPTNGAAMRAAPLGVWWAAASASRQEAWAFIAPVLAITHRHPVALAAGFGQAFAVSYALRHSTENLDVRAFWAELISLVQWVEGELRAPNASLSKCLAQLGEHLTDFPLDLLDLCNGAGVYAAESWPFAVAMFARNPGLLEGTLLSTVNAGGDADTTGSMTGSLLGALHGWSAFPSEWRAGLEDAARLETEAHNFAEHTLTYWAERIAHGVIPVLC